MATQIKLRRDTAVNWTNANPTLGQGEPGYDLTSRRLKIGDGVTAWNSLDWFDDQITNLSAYGGNIVPDTDNAYDLGSPSMRWRHGYFASGSLYVGDIKLTNNAGSLIVQQVSDPGLETEAPLPDTPGTVTTDRIVNNGNTFSINADGTLSLNGSPFTGGGSGTANIGTLKIINGNIGTVDNPDTGGWGGYNILISPNGEGNSWVYLPTNNNSNSGGSLEIGNTGTGGVRLYGGTNGNVWTFDNNGLTIPASSRVEHNYSYTRSTTANVNVGTPAVIWSSTANYISGAKLFIQVEATEQGDATGWHSQTCEAVIASRGYAAGINGRGDPVMTVYAVTYTSTQPLVTFTVRRNTNTGVIEVVGTNTLAAATTANLRIHSIEMVTTD